jgi:tetratricopeptide (TPR) repeat protein
MLYQGLSPTLQEPRVWTALGFARQALAETSAARRYHRRAALRELSDPALTAASQSPDEYVTCATAADLSSCSHNALHLGLVDFGAGNASLGVGHVELLLSRTDAVSAEAAEWLTRFARATAWVPSGRDFGGFLLGRVEPLLKSEGEARLARHFVEYGRFLLANRDKPAKLKRALTQLSRARDIIEKADLDVGMGDVEVASLYSTMGAVQHQVGDIQQAVESFENALKYDRRAAAAGGKPDYKRMLLSHANLGAMRLQLAGSDSRRWRVAIEDLSDGRRMAREAGLSLLDPIVQKFEASYRNAMRLAHHRGMLDTCPGPLDAFLYGPTCSSDV